MKKIVLTLVCALSAMLAFAVQYPVRHYVSPLVRLRTTQRVAPKNGVYYTPLSQVDEQAYSPKGSPISSRWGVYDSKLDYFPEDMMEERNLSSYTAISAFEAGTAATESTPVSENSSGRSSSKPRRITIGGGTWEGDEGDGETYIWSGADKGGTYVDNGDGTYTFYDADGELIGTYKADVTPGGVITLGEVVRNPIGSPVLPFLLFAMMACGVIYYRRKHAVTMSE